MSRDAAVPEHIHDKEWELLAMLEGEGEYDEAGRQGVHGEDGEWRNRGGASRVKHSFQPAGSKRTLGVQVHAPPGPEQRFKTLAGK